MIDERIVDQELNIALLIDADNASPDHLDQVLLVLGELGAGSAGVGIDLRGLPNDAHGRLSFDAHAVGYAAHPELQLGHLTVAAEVREHGTRIDVQRLDGSAIGAYLWAAAASASIGRS